MKVSQEIKEKPLVFDPISINIVFESADEFNTFKGLFFNTCPFDRKKIANGVCKELVLAGTMNHNVENCLAFVELLELLTKIKKDRNI